MEKDKSFLGTEPVGKLLLQLALPTVAAQLINMLYNIVDRIYIGHIPGEGALALTGVGVCMPLIMVVSAFAALVGNGGAPRASIFMGKNDTSKAEQTLGNCFTMQIIISLILTVILFLGNRSFLLAFGASANTIDYAVGYMNIYAVGTIFVQLTLGMNNFITAQGFAKTGMLSVLIGAVSNIILDPVFIFGLGQGAAGAAMATVIGNVIADVYYIYVMSKKAKRLSVSLKEIKIPGTMIRDILVIGIPASITNLMQSIMIMITNHYLIAYGTDKVAAMGIALKANMISAFILVGFAFGGQPLVGYNYGARNKKRLKEILRFAYLFEAGLALVFTILISIFAPFIIKIFMNQSDIITNGAMMLRFQQLGMVFMAITLVSTCVCQSVGSAAGAFVLSISRQGVIYAILLIVLKSVFGYTGILATQACADVVTALIAIGIIRKVLGGMKNEIQDDRI